MILYNLKMKELLSSIDIDSIISNKNYYSVIEKTNNLNELYYIIQEEATCYVEHTSASGSDLSDFEYNKNEIYIQNNINIIYVLTLSIKILKSIKNILEENYKNTKFDLILVIEEYDNLPRATIRMYSIRDNYRIIQLDELDNYKNEYILIDRVNQ